MKARIYLIDSESNNPVVAIIRPKREFSSEKEARVWMDRVLIPSMGLTPNRPSEGKGRIVVGFKYPGATGWKSLPIWVMKIFLC
jgi:hypothetical protein